MIKIEQRPKDHDERWKALAVEHRRGDESAYSLNPAGAASPTFLRHE
jgi:hypothetical protein